jgi:hypothetical protein
MRTDVARDYWDDWGLALLWTSMLLGPLAVSLDLLVGYALVKPLCASGDAERLRLISFAALSLTVIGIVVGASCYARLRQTAVDDGGRVIDRSYFMAVVAIGFNVLCAILIMTAGGARFIMSCE